MIPPISFLRYVNTITYGCKFCLSVWRPGSSTHELKRTRYGGWRMSPCF